MGLIKQMSKINLLEKIRTGHERFNALLAELSDAQLIKPGVIGIWSVKDIVAHIVIHEQRMLQWMTERMQGRNPIAFQPFDMPEKELNELNENIYQENCNRDWMDVFQDWEKTHSQTLRLIEAANEEDLMSAQRFRLLGGEPLWVAVAVNTFEHCEEHGRDIRAWVARK
jgi:hypothetical protein